MIRELIVLTGLLGLAGCASEGYQCKAPLACNPVHHNYRTAVRDNGWNGWQSGTDKVAPNNKGNDEGGGGPPRSLPAPGGPSMGLPYATGGGDIAGPAYTPPRPWRVWLSPWSRGDGTLESGTYIWFVTPGHWNYLGHTWKAPPQANGGNDGDDANGFGDGTLGPIAPDALGFTPGKAMAPKGVIDSMTQPQGGN